MEVGGRLNAFFLVLLYFNVSDPCLVGVFYGPGVALGVGVGEGGRREVRGDHLSQDLTIFEVGVSVAMSSGRLMVLC